MSLYLLWAALHSVLGNPIVALVLVAAIAWFVGRRTFFRARPLRYWSRARRATELRRQLERQDWNRAARFELADWLVERRQFAEAAAILAPNLTQEDDDDTLFVMGVATYGAGNVAEGERLLGRVAERNPKFKTWSVFLELGRYRLAHGDVAGAVQALERFVAARLGTVEGRVLLGRAYLAAGDRARAALLRQEAWKNYRLAPRFQRRSERFWAYRVRPWLGAAWVALGAAAALGMLLAIVALTHPSPHRMTAELDDDLEAMDAAMFTDAPCGAVQDPRFVGRYAVDRAATMAAARGEIDLTAFTRNPGAEPPSDVLAELEVLPDRVLIGRTAEICYLERDDGDTEPTTLVVDTVWRQAFDARTLAITGGLEANAQGIRVRLTLHAEGTRLVMHFHIPYGGSQTDTTVVLNRVGG